MRDPFAGLSTSALSVLTVVLFAGIAGALAVLHRTERSIAPSHSADLQRIHTREQADATLAGWSEETIRVAIKGLLVDSFLLVPLYATFLVAGCSLAARWLPLLRYLIWCGWIAGVFDELENIATIVELRGKHWIAPLALGATAMKFVFIGLSFPACLPLFVLFWLMSR